LKIRHIETVHRTRRPGDYPEVALPEIAFLGRSNVGKSSLINTLVNRKKLAPTSRTPGKTRSIDWYRIDGQGSSCFFVDLPGYGFARVPKKMREELWARLIDTYLTSQRPLVLAVQLLDMRRDGPTDLDWQMIEWLEEVRVPRVFALTKADKLNRGARQRALQEFRDVLDSEKAIPFSAVDGDGKRELWSAIDRSLRQAA